MVNSIGSATLAQAAPAAVKNTQLEETAVATTTTETTESAAVSENIETRSELSSATARVGGQLEAQAGAARVARAPGGGASETESADYIAEADTNSDKKVSDEERAIYEKKLEQQAQEVRKTYGLDTRSEAAIAVTA